MARFYDKREVSKNTMFEAARFRNEHVAQSLCDRKLSNKMSSSLCTHLAVCCLLCANRGDAELEPFWVIPWDAPHRPQGVC